MNLTKTESNANSSKRIALNTITTYSRSLIAAGLTLFSSRWVLNALGQTDYGLYSLIGSIIIFVVLLNNVMAGSVARFFAFSIGQGNPVEVQSWFSAAFRMHLFLALILSFIGWPVGDYVIKNILSIPNDRQQVCLAIFHFSLISAFISMVSVPFIAMFTARQRIFELAIWGLFQSFLNFGYALFIRDISGDKLLTYAFGMSIIIVLIQIIQVFRAISEFPECRICSIRNTDVSKIKKIFSFSVLNLVGSLGGISRDQGSAIIINLFFGPRMNAAYSIANQVSTQANQLSSSMLNAFSPEITSNEGKGNHSRTFNLSFQANKISTTLIALFAIPLVFEIDYILRLWLIEVPAESATFCRILLLTFMIDRLGTGYNLASSAIGKIAPIQLATGIILVLTLPVSFYLYRAGGGPIIISYVFLVSIVVLLIAKIFIGKVMFEICPIKWLSTVLTPSLIIISMSVLAAIITTSLFMEGLLRLVLTTTTCIIANIMGTWLLIISKEQRKRIMLKIKGKRKGLHNGDYE